MPPTVVNETTRLLHNHVQESHENNEADIVDWDGPNDPANPQNWSEAKTWVHVLIVSLLTFLVPLGATMFAPATQQVMQELKPSATGENGVLASLMVSIYVLGWALGPLVLAPLSESDGRLPVYTVTSVLYIAATVACALAPSIGFLVFFRFVAGSVGSAPLTIGGGTISDLVPVQTRGLALSLYMFGPILGPSVGPLMGGYLVETLGWRWIFWVLAILYGVMTIVQVFFMSETYPATILEKKTRSLRQKTGNFALRSKLDQGISARQVLVRAITRPTRMLIMSPINLILALVSAYVNGVVFLLLTTAPVMFRVEYGFTARDVGLAFIGFGIGNIGGLATFTLTSDRIIQKRAAQRRLRPEDRLLPALAALPILAFGLLWYGWSATAHTHWAVPIAGSAFIGAGNVLFSSAVIGYLIDSFTIYAASAIASNTILRSIGGTALPLGGQHLYAILGWGWGSSLLAFVALLMTTMLAYLYLRGEVLRSRYPVRL
ncbi:major facilitator superfamily domain-containing protein [Xylaria scruposa]|nr:major facilitator superfamily domain-containing protein [Xylaria scruposa]